MKQKLILIGAGLVVLVVGARLVMARSSSGDVAVDTTGASASSAGPPGTPGVSVVASPNARANGTPGAVLSKATGPTQTPVVVQIQGTAVSIQAKPLLLLNPSTVRQGSSVGVAGSGFDPGAVVDIYVKQQEDDQVDPLTFVQVDKSGGFGGVSFNVPDTLPRGSFIVEADQREGTNVARATAVVAGGSPQVKLATQAAKSGDTVQLSLAGFSPNEGINIYWNDLSGDVIGTLEADDNGGLRQGAVRVPFGAVGNNGFIFVGQKSQSPVTVPFQMLNLYPNVDLSSYAIKPDNVLSFSGKDFGPGEDVTLYLNNPEAPPLTTIHTDEEGGFTNAGGFLVPFGLQGKQTLIFIGQQSKAPTTASFDTLPYTPSAQPSTYGGRPGTTLTFYAIGFARNEVVHALIGRTAESAGTEVTCFRADGQGNAASGGSYVVPGDATPGQLIFSLLGSRSQAVATAALEVIASDVPVQLPAQPPFQCDLTDGADAPQVVGAADDPQVVSSDGPSPNPSVAISPSPSAVARAVTAAKATPAAKPATKANAIASPSPKPKASATPRASATPQKNPAIAAPSPTAAEQEPAAEQHAPTAPSSTATAAPESAEETYTVADDDTLPSIAAHFYGDADQWTAIYTANRATIGDDPNLVQAGMKLTIPQKES